MKIKIVISFLLAFLLHGKAWSGEPKIVNIVNFIRLLEPRDPAITEDILYQTVVKQVEIMKQYDLPGTFLLQYDALMDPRYQKLLRQLPKESFEIGGWWEIPQPLVEKAGLKWRGRYPWDWHADVGFSTGYTPQEREKLIDVYMADFKTIFGYYPKSVGSWFIDSYSLNYMYEKYHIVASSNCKDQYGTDGYTLWGGYWNQAYYPSKTNSYMPAQHSDKQIPVPIFRMLGSDPIRQYDQGLGAARQGVISLEPVYPDAGGDSAWVNWFFKSFTDGEALAFNYTQAGQENSFIWNEVEKGFKIQMPLIAKLRKEKKIRVETLAQSGLWFRKNFAVTPATSFVVNDDLKDSNLKTAWFNSRYYRINLMWEDGTLRIRDLHLFDEDLPSAYHTGVAKSNECTFFTLPVVDGYLWSKKGNLAGMRLKAVIGGQEILLKGKNPVFTSVKEGTLHISWPLTTIQGTLEMDMDENSFEVKLNSAAVTDWYFELERFNDKVLPFESIENTQLNCKFEGLSYAVKSTQGTFSKLTGNKILKLSPVKNKINLSLSNH